MFGNGECTKVNHGKDFYSSIKVLWILHPGKKLNKQTIIQVQI